MRDKSPYRSENVVPNVSIDLDGITRPVDWDSQSLLIVSTGTKIHRRWSVKKIDADLIIDGISGVDFYRPFQFSNLLVTGEYLFL